MRTAIARFAGPAGAFLGPSPSGRRSSQIQPIGRPMLFIRPRKPSTDPEAAPLWTPKGVQRELQLALSFQPDGGAEVEDLLPITITRPPVVVMHRDLVKPPGGVWHIRSGTQERAARLENRRARLPNAVLFALNDQVLFDAISNAKALYAPGGLCGDSGRRVRAQHGRVTEPDLVAGQSLSQSRTISARGHQPVDNHRLAPPWHLVRGSGPASQAGCPNKIPGSPSRLFCGRHAHRSGRRRRTCRRSARPWR